LIAHNQFAAINKNSHFLQGFFQCERTSENDRFRRVLLVSFSIKSGAFGADRGLAFNTCSRKV
jgi:hypothetical protein